VKLRERNSMITVLRKSWIVRPLEIED